MRTLILLTVVALANFSTAAPGGAHGGIVLSGPSGIVTSHGPIGPAALGLGGLGFGHGAGAVLAGPVGPSAVFAGPAASHASIFGPAAGLGLGFAGFGGFGGFGFGSGLGLAHGVAVTNGGGSIGLSHHGVTVKGPATVPATIAGPAGKIVADGLYGVPGAGHGW